MHPCTIPAADSSPFSGWQQQREVASKASSEVQQQPGRTSHQSALEAARAFNPWQRIESLRRWGSGGPEISAAGIIEECCPGQAEGQQDDTGLAAAGSWAADGSPRGRSSPRSSPRSGVHSKRAVSPLLRVVALKAAVSAGAPDGPLNADGGSDEDVDSAAGDDQQGCSSALLRDFSFGIRSSSFLQRSGSISLAWGPGKAAPAAAVQAGPPAPPCAPAGWCRPAAEMGGAGREVV